MKQNRNSKTLDIYVYLIDNDSGVSSFQYMGLAGSDIYMKREKKRKKKLHPTSHHT